MHCLGKGNPPSLWVSLSLSESVSLSLSLCLSLSPSLLPPPSLSSLSSSPRGFFRAGLDAALLDSPSRLPQPLRPRQTLLPPPPSGISQGSLQFSPASPGEVRAPELAQRNCSVPGPSHTLFLHPGQPTRAAAPERLRTDPITP